MVVNPSTDIVDALVPGLQIDDQFQIVFLADGGQAVRKLSQRQGEASQFLNGQLVLGLFTDCQDTTGRSFHPVSRNAGNPYGRSSLRPTQNHAR